MRTTLFHPKDSSGRTLTRSASTIKGWHYQAMSFEITTTTGEFFCQDAYGNDLSGEFDVTFSPTETTCTWKPEYDYEIVSGNMFSSGAAMGLCRLWALGGATDLGQAGSKEFVRGMRLDIVGKVLQTDGRSSKFMRKTTEGVPVNTNKFKFIFKHVNDLEHTVNIVIEIFRQ